jgi:CspA family cold shock protein
MGTKTAQTGTVKFYLDDKGYGFITPDNTSGKDIFFHLTGLLDDVKKGDKVSFEVEDSKRGDKAVNITLIK